MLWENPLAPPREEAGKRARGPAPDRLPASVGVATEQFPLPGIARSAQFEQPLAHFVAVAADYAADLGVFPEIYTPVSLYTHTKHQKTRQAGKKCAETRE